LEIHSLPPLRFVTGWTSTDSAGLCPCGLIHFRALASVALLPRLCCYQHPSASAISDYITHSSRGSGLPSRGFATNGTRPLSVIKVSSRHPQLCLKAYSKPEWFNLWGFTAQALPRMFPFPGLALKSWGSRVFVSRETLPCVGQHAWATNGYNMQK
jgi:hypothetical protein